MTDQTAEQRMAEVLAAHGSSGIVSRREGWIECMCGSRLLVDRVEFAGIQAVLTAHQAAALVAAGFGDVRQAGAEAADLRSRLACVAEATYWDRPYDTRIAAIRGMCDLTTNGMTPIGGAR